MTSKGRCGVGGGSGRKVENAERGQRGKGRRKEGVGLGREGKEKRMRMEEVRRKERKEEVLSIHKEYYC